ncbi:hypothetical protein Cni_G16159 [Canna indica]|uniref:LOB domain-containing protein n=1 Tax=Canna indica TaxID=4628 RepID=A0AAQ3KI73_9LILI|nr:hypothetical protein Cni_G16159 [Canna indica]
MTGFGSPCGACKFLRRKCVRGCVFAPYFCHDQGAAHFAAIHKVFGASNFSKLLLHLPLADRSEAAVTISYEAQARLQDPVYGCVAHIFALQQQVVNLQAQLASLKSQAAAAANQACSQEDKLPTAPGGALQGFFQTGDGRILPPLSSNISSMHADAMNSYAAAFPASSSSHYGGGEEHMAATAFGAEEEGSFGMESPEGIQANTWRSAYHDMEDLQSVALAYLGRS